MLSGILQTVVLALTVTAVIARPDPATRKIVLKNYDKGSLPYGDGDAAVVVRVGNLTVNSIELEEKTQQFIVKGWLHLMRKQGHAAMTNAALTNTNAARLSASTMTILLMWSDPGLSWGSEVKPNKDKEGYLHFSPDEVWLPDLAIYNAAQPKNLLEYYGKTDVLVGFNGTVLWVPAVELRTTCNLNLRKWPYDTQNCAVRLGLWTHDEGTVNVTLSDDPMPAVIDSTTIPTMENSQWALESAEISRSSKEYPCCPGESYVTLDFQFEVKRSSYMYTYSVILPIILITVLNILIFFLPKHRGEKLTLGLFNFLIVCIFLLHFNNELPVLSNAPLIVTLYGANLFFIAAILAVATMVINCTDGSHVTGTPKWINWIFNRTIASVLCLKSLQKVTNAKREGRSYSFKAGTAGNGSVAIEEPLNPDQAKPSAKDADAGNKAEWYYLAAVLDRVFLIDYVLLSVFLMIYVHL